MIVTELIRHEFFFFFLPHFPVAPKCERPLLPGQAGALWEGPAPLGRNRESRTREAAGRRNSPEAVPRKTCGRKSVLSDNQRTGSWLEVARVTRNARRLADQHASPVAQGCSTPKQQLLSTA